MQIDFSKTDSPSSVASVSVSCIYKVLGDQRYRGSKMRGIKRVGNVAIRTFGGTGELYFYDGEHFELSENSLIIVPYSRISHYLPKNDKWWFWWFEYEKGEGLIQENRIFHLDFNVGEEALSSNALGLLREKNMYSCEAASAFFSTLICSWRRTIASISESKTDSAIYNLLQKIRRHPEEEYTLSGMAASCSMSQRNLHNIFIKNTGLSPKEYVIKVRMEYARDLLIHTSLTVSHIAVKCGYSDRFYFSRAFSEFWGISPSKFRSSV